MKTVRKTEKEKKKEMKKRLQTGEWTLPEKLTEATKAEPIPKPVRFNWADEV